jgi:phage baseplate assembly protein W
MAYKGFNTIGQHRKFSLAGRDLVVQDLNNAMNIREGSLPGRPEYGTNIWNYLFEPNTPDVERRVLSEIQKLIDADPRITLVNTNFFSQFNGMSIELEVRIVPNVDVETLVILFDQDSNNATVRPANN